MSEENNAVEERQEVTTEQSSESQPELTLEQLQAELEKERQSKERILAESKDYKKKFQDTRTKLDTVERSVIEQRGTIEEQLEYERGRNKELRGENESLRESTIRNKLVSEISKVAKDAHDVDMLLKVTAHKNKLKIDPDTLDVDGVEDFVSAARESHGYLFSKGSLPNMENRKLSGEQAKPLSVDQQYIQELRSCKTQKEFDEVRKKYGKE